MTSAAPEICRHLRISGRVQGVGYRDWAVRTARSFGLNGWVRNRMDNSVEVVAAGPADAVAQFIDACSEGPPLARVTDIAVHELHLPELEGFDFRPTA